MRDLTRRKIKMNRVTLRTVKEGKKRMVPQQVGSVKMPLKSDHRNSLSPTWWMTMKTIWPSIIKIMEPRQRLNQSRSLRSKKSQYRPKVSSSVTLRSCNNSGKAHSAKCSRLRSEIADKSTQ